MREGLTVVVSVKVPQPQFEGQTKTKLGNSYMKSLVDNVVGNGLGFYLEEHPQTARLIIDKCITASRAREAARRARDLTRKKTGLENISLPGKLADCNSNEPEKCEIFLVEGDSAGGSAKMVEYPSQLLVVIGIPYVLAPCNSIKGRLGGVNVAVLYQRPHVPVEEGQKQYAYMRAVHVRIRHANSKLVVDLDV